MLIIILRESCLGLCLGYVKTVGWWKTSQVLERKGDIHRLHFRVKSYPLYLMQKSSLLYWKSQTNKQRRDDKDNQADMKKIQIEHKNEK